MTDMDGCDIVGQAWPYDGPHDADTVTSAAEALAGLVRYLNNATLTRSTLPFGSSVNRMLAYLVGMTSGLDQLLRQLSDRVVRLKADPTLYDDRRDRPGADTAGELALVLDRATGELQLLVDRLTEAHELASHLGHKQQPRNRAQA